MSLLAKLFVRSVAVLLASLLVFGAASAQNAPVTITMWHIATQTDPFHPVLQGAIDRFNAAHADVQIAAQAIENAIFKQQLEQAIAAGQPPDVFQTWGGGLLQAYAQQGVVRPIAALDGGASSLFVPAALAPSTFENQHYAVPANLAGVFLWYNRDLFSRYSVSLPETWTQLLDACRAFRNAGITPIALGNREPWSGSLWYTYLAVRIGGEAAYVNSADDAAKIQSNKPVFEQVGERIREAVGSQCFETDFDSTSFPDAQRLLGTGTAAMQLQGDWNLGGLRNYDPALDNFGVLPFPTVETGADASNVFVGGTGQAFAIAAGAPAETEAALMELLTSADYGRAVAEAGYIPALEGYQASITNPLVQQMAFALENAPHIQLYYDQALPPALAQTHLRTTDQLFLGALTPQAAVEQMAAPPAEPAVNVSAPATLRQLADSQGIAIGAAVSIAPLRDNPQYADILRREFNLLTTEVALKMDRLRPDRNTFDFGDADFIVDFALANGMQVRGHPLVWHRQLPGWLEYGNFSRDELLAILHEHIATVVGRYRGRVVAWDVVNEAFNDDGTFRDSVWMRTIGPEYIDYAFQWAREADPDALLFYNDFDAEAFGAKSDAVYGLLQGLIARQVPVDGVGMQMHISLGEHPSMEDVQRNMERLAALGLQVQITEMDVSIQDGAGTDEERINQQAQLYADAARACLRVDACTAFVTWGFSDHDTWLVQETGYPDKPLLFDTNYQPKPAYYALLDALRF